MRRPVNVQFTYKSCDFVKNEKANLRLRVRERDFCSLFSGSQAFLSSPLFRSEPFERVAALAGRLVSFPEYAVVFRIEQEIERAPLVVRYALPQRSVVLAPEGIDGSFGDGQFVVTSNMVSENMPSPL